MTEYEERRNKSTDEDGIQLYGIRKCPHCQKVEQNGHWVRFHGDNCKLNPEKIIQKEEEKEYKQG